MQKCPKCLAEQNNVNSHTCFYCGADMSNSPEYTSQADIQTDNDDYIPEQSISLPDSDDLGIETNADIMESEAHNLSDTSPTEEIKTTSNNFSKQYNEENHSSDSKNESSNIKKLSDSEIKEIEKNLYKSDNFINDKDKSDLIEKISSINTDHPEPFSNKPIEPPKHNKAQKETPNSEVAIESELPKPQIAKKGQGLAYFYHSYIQLQGSQKLHPDDEMIINNRNYILKPKNLSKNFTLYSVAASLVIIVLIIGSFLVGNSSVGNGQVIGIILDENDQPFIEGATVVFSELGEKVNSDAQGLFSFSNIPTGSHKIEYLINNEITGSDYITIANNNNSYITLKPSSQKSAGTQTPLKQLTIASSQKKPIEKLSFQKPSSKKETVQIAKKTTPKKKKKTSKSKTTTKKQVSGYGKLALNANVEGAKIKVDGNVLGAGNLTYTKIKSGKHSYTVSLDGYETAKGTFSIKKGKTKKLSPTLKLLTQTKKEETFKGNDYFYSAQNAYKQGDYTAAIADYQKVIDKTPNNVKAYYGTAESYSKLKKWDLAYENYIRSAEIYQFKGRVNDAISCYNKAVDVNKNLANAYLGRGEIYLDAGEYRAALIDFDKVVKLEKRNFRGYYGMGEASFKLQRYTKAVKYFKDARSLDNTNPLVHQYLTLSYMYEHDRKNTKKSFEKFERYASENDKNKFKNNSQYSAVIKYIDSE